VPLVAHYDLPTFERLRAEGQTVLPPELALHQDIRELHIGLLNMMPDGALTATERQFFRLIGQSNKIAQFYVHPFTLPELPRSAEAEAYIRRYYRPIDEVRSEGLDALIITGANITQPDLCAEPFWKPLAEIIDWACESVTSTLCSCLATHAVLRLRYGIERRRLRAKRWGVFTHQVIEPRHPLVRDVNTRFDVPHSRFNDISRQQFESAGLRVLAASESAGVHLATSEDGFRVVFLQGHPEYDTTSLLKEYKREVHLFAYGGRLDYPPFPERYLSPQARAILEEYRDQVIDALDRGEEIPPFPEDLVAPRLDNTWHDTAEAIVNNWVGSIYQITHPERKLPFMEGVDPKNPLGLAF